MHACALHVIIRESKAMTLKRCLKQKFTCQTGHIWGSAWWETPRGCPQLYWPTKATATMSTWFRRKLRLGCQNSFRKKVWFCVICKKKVFSLFYSEGRQLVGYIYRGWGKEKTIEGESWAELWQNFGGYFIHYSPSFFFTSSVPSNIMI